jgi:hypothetical protein
MRLVSHRVIRRRLFVWVLLGPTAKGNADRVGDAVVVNHERQVTDMGRHFDLLDQTFSSNARSVARG